MPFDAMKGLQEALRDREERHSRVEKHDISEEQMEKNSEAFSRIKKGSLVRLELWRAFHDVTLSGTVTAISMSYRFLKIGEEKVFFSDVYSAEILETDA